MKEKELLELSGALSAAKDGNPININEYFIKDSKENKNKKKVINRNCHSDLFFKMNTNFLKPNSTNICNEPKEKMKESHKEPDLDLFMNNKIKQNLEKKYNSNKFEQINKNFCNYLKKEEFDKKEFSYGRKMLLMKKKEELGDKSHDPDFANNLKINKEIKTEVEDLKNQIHLGEFVEEQNKNKIVSKKGAKCSLTPTETKEDEPIEKKTNKFVDIILKHRKVLNLNSVADQILELRKEREARKKETRQKNFNLETSRSNL